MLWVWCGTALAGSLAGTQVPSVGGAFAGATEAGALGVIFQPAASVRGAGPEVAVDLGGIQTTLSREAEGWGGPLVTSGWTAQPTVMASVPIGPVGVGAALHGSYLRTGDGDPEGPQRLFTISSVLSMIEGDVTASVRPVDVISFGAGARIGVLEFSSVKGTDLAATLNGSLAPDPPLPVGDPLLEGTQTLGPMQRVTYSWLAGAAVHLDRVQLDLSFRPGWKTRLVGPVQLVPSDDLNSSVDGTIQLTLAMPAHVLGAARIDVTDRWTIIPQLEWVGWGAAGKNSATITGLVLTSTDPVLNGLLSASGLSEADFLTASEGTQDADLRWRDVVNGSAQVLYEPAEDWELRGGLGLSPTAIPSTWVTPANLDFTSLVLTAGAAWQPSPVVRFALAGQRYQTFTRRVTTSPYSMTDPPEGLAILPSGNGRYALSLWRIGLTVQLMIPTRSEPS